MTNIESRAVRRAKRGSAVRGHSRRVAASVLSLALAFSLAPAAASWAEEPGDQGSQPVTGGDPSGQGEQVGGSGGEQTGGTGGGEEGGTGGSEEGTDGVQPSAGSEELPGLALQVRIASDGTPSWDANSNAGNDSGPSNGIVRVNDTVSYEVEYAVSNNDAANLTWSMTFPKGMELTLIPGYCKAAGSSLLPATAGTPAIPLTANSVDELSEQTLTCNMGDRSVATDKVFVTAKVLNLAHQGQDLPILAATVTADGVEAPVAATAPLPSVKASARLMWDISKNGVALAENSGYYYGPINQPCPWEPARTCKRTNYGIQLSAPAGGKGAMPAVGDITFTDDLSPTAMYPGLSAADIAAIEADLDKYGSRAVAFTTGYGQPGSKIGSNQETVARSAVNSVRDSGNLTAVQAGPGQPVSLTVSGADMSLRTYPSEALRPVGTALPGNAAYAVALGLDVYTPVDTIRDFGIESSTHNSWTLPTYNSFSDLDILGFDPATDVQTSADQPGANATKLPSGVDGPVHWNDYRTTSPKVELTGAFTKRFAGLPGAAGNMTANEFAPGSNIPGEGPPGGAVINSGGITVAPTQTVTSQMFFKGTKPDAPAPVSAIGCDAWDNTKLNLHATDAPAAVGAGYNASMQRVPSGGEAVWVSGYNNVPGSYFATAKSQVPDAKFQYSATPGAAETATECGDAQGSWYDEPSQVPGNDPALASEGIYTAVARVRAFVNMPEPVSNDTILGDGVYLTVSIGLRVADNGMAAGTILPNYGGVKMIIGQELTPEELLTHSQQWGQSVYSPGTHSGSGGDRLIFAHAQVRVDKQVRKGDTGGFSDTPPQVTGGDLVQYRLAPSLTSGAMTPGILKDVWVEDCLPASQSYDTASISPAVVTLGSTPADAQRPACAAGETYIRWVLPDHEVNTVIDPIILSVEVSPTANDGVYTNTVVVWAEDDASTLAQRRDQAQVQIANIAGIKLEKVALTPVVQVNRVGQGTNELNRWVVRLTNTLPASEQSGVSNPDLIDVLPRQGAEGTDFAGTFKFVSATPAVGDTQTRILYTKTANVSANPQDASNGAAGATTWCDAPAGGTRVSGVNGCPASAAEVTGVRIQRAGAYNSGDVVEVEIAMVGVGNEAGDVYVNRVMAAAAGLDNTVGPIRRPEVAIASSLGDYVWWDLNRNGVQDQFQGAPEQPASGVMVRLAGTDDLGNAVSLETRTDAEGRYSFPGLRSSDEAGYTVTFVKPDGSEFTVKQVVGADAAFDANADPVTGVADAVVLAPNSADVTIDAGLMPYGGLQINKTVTGAGVDFSAEDVLEFTVVCEFDGEPVLLADPSDPEADPAAELTLSVPVNGAAQVLSEVIAGIPAYADCAITETGSGSADEAAKPIEVQISWDAAAQRAGVERASLTNFYSAGTVAVSKQLTGDAQAVEYVKNVAFEVLVTCQIEEPGEGDEMIRTTVYSGSVRIKGGQTKMLVTDGGDPRALPLGTRCFGEEVDTGGAANATVEFGSFENAAVVTAGSPDELQRLTITAVNTFQCTEAMCGKLTVTGGQLTGIVIGITGAGIVLAGLVMLVLKRRRREQSVLP